MEGTRSSSCRSLDVDGDVEIEAEAPGRVHTFDGSTNKYGAPAMGEPSIDIYFSFLPCVWRLALPVLFFPFLSLFFVVYVRSGGGIMLIRWSVGMTVVL
jgi:hypothetical protein